MKLETELSERFSRPTLRSAAFFGVALSPFGLLVAGAIRTASPVLGSALLVAVSIAVVALGSALARLNASRRDTVVVSDRGVLFGSTLVPRAAIRAAYFVPAVEDHPARVRIVGEKDVELLELVVRDQAEANLAIEALGIAPETTTRWSALAPVGLSLMMVFLAAAALIAMASAFHTAVLALAGLLTAFAGTIYFLPATIHIGADGVYWKTRSSPRFIGWGEVEAVATTARHLVLRMKRGGAIEILVHARVLFHANEKNFHLETLGQRAHDAHAAFNERNSVNAAARVGRLGSTTAEWIARLRAADGNFRLAPLRSDDLWSVVEDPSAEASARAGAAALLAKRASDDDRVRLRIAADTCAEPRLRVVLGKAAEADDVMEDLEGIGDSAKVTR